MRRVRFSAFECNSGFMRRLMKVSEVAVELRVSERTVRKRISAGDIPALRLGRESHAPVRVDEEALRAWLASGATTRVS